MATPPEATAQEWADAEQAFTQPGLHANPPGFRERIGSVARNLRDRKIMGRPLYEVAADFGAGYVVKSAIRSHVILAGTVVLGTSTLGAIGAAVMAGAASGAAFAGGKEWIRQTRENWQQPLPPEAVTKKQQILERLKDLNPNDWRKLGKVTLRGATVGAVFGLAGGLFSEAIHAATAAPGGDHLTSTTPTAEPTHTPSIPTETHVPVETSTPVPTETSIPTIEPSATIPGFHSPTPFMEPSATPGVEHFTSTPEATVPPTATHIPGTSTATPFTEPTHSPSISTQTATPVPTETHIPTIPATHTPTPEITSTPIAHPDISQPNPMEPPAATHFPGVHEGTGFTPSPSGELPTTPTIPSIPSGPGFVPPPPGEIPTIPGVPPIDTLNTLTESIQNLKDIPLAAGSNPWELAKGLLEQVNPDAIPSNAEIMQVTRALCEQNNIGVPEWNISGLVDEHEIPIGYLFKITPTVKSVVLSAMKGGQ